MKYKKGQNHKYTRLPFLLFQLYKLLYYYLFLLEELLLEDEDLGEELLLELLVALLLLDPALLDDAPLLLFVREGLIEELLLLDLEEFIPEDLLVVFALLVEELFLLEEEFLIELVFLLEVLSLVILLLLELLFLAEVERALDLPFSDTCLEDVVPLAFAILELLPVLLCVAVVRPLYPD